ncbi:MAG: TraM recognition domain-containing protein [Elusimicrobia bacterium]|nr:TraM recognition domain-containing protein [Elusimicrobiota bacterium]
MSQVLFLLMMAVMAASLVLLGLGYKKTGAAVFAKAAFIFLAFLPWRTVDLLVRDNARFRKWAVPRMGAVRRGWYSASGAFSLAVGLCIALRKSKQGRRSEWDEPKDQRGLDKALEKHLDRGAEKAGTFMGMAAGGRSVFLTPVSRERHMQIVGPTRSGKSQFLFALSAQDMRQGMPVFFMEAKGDHSDFDQFHALADRCGRGSAVRYFNPQDPRSHTFNPIRPVPGQDATALANQLARVLGREPKSSGEGKDYYLQVDYAKIQNMAEIFWKSGLQFTFRDCFYYFSRSECREKAFRACNDEALVAMARQEFEQNPDTTALTSAIRPWTTGVLGDLLNTYSPQIKLEDIFNDKQLAYFAIPIGHLQVLANPLGRMLISGLLSVATWRQQARVKPGPASVILDEFAEFATPAFKSFIQTVGSARFWTILSHQDLGQLRNIEGMDADAFESAVFNNTSGCKVCFRTPDPEDAEFWSSMLGTYSTFDDTERVQKSFLGTRGTGEMSRRKVEHFKVHPNTLKNLKPGSALVFAPGHEDTMARTARVFKLAGGRTPELEAVMPETEEGLDLASAAKPSQKTAVVNERGLRS